MFGVSLLTDIECRDVVDSTRIGVVIEADDFIFKFLGLNRFDKGGRIFDDPFRKASNDRDVVDLLAALPISAVKDFDKLIGHSLGLCVLDRLVCVIGTHFSWPNGSRHFDVVRCQ